MAVPAQTREPLCRDRYAHLFPPTWKRSPLGRRHDRGKGPNAEGVWVSLVFGEAANDVSVGGLPWCIKLSTMWWNACGLRPGSASLLRLMVAVTGTALTDDAKVEPIGDKAILISDAIEGTLDSAQRNGCRVSATLAHEVMVVLVRRQMVDTGLVAQMYMVNEAELFEFVECSVHGRAVDAAGRHAYPFVDLTGGEMIILTGS